MDTKIKKLNKAQVQMLRKEIQQELDKIGATYGMTIKLGNIRFDNVSLRTKLEAFVNEPASGISFEQEAFESQCWKYSLKPEDYLKEVKLGGRLSGTPNTAKIYGFNSRAKRYPILVRTDSGQQIKASTVVLSQLRQGTLTLK